MKQGLGFGKGFVAGVFVLALLISLVGFALALVPNPGHSWNEIECNSVLCVKQSGKIGVGTTTPFHNVRLTVHGGGDDGGSALFESMNGANGIYVNGQNGLDVDDSAYISFTSVNNFDNANPSQLRKVMIGRTGRGSAPANSLRFITNSQERMRITPQGKVGIGTSSPDYLLHLKTANSNTVLKIEGDLGKAHGLHITDPTDKGFAIAKGDNNLFIDWSTKVGDSSVAPRRVLTITP
ncbi:hypothetical protein D6817_04180, partial [Candidatus Pacearchaeota archaeon]